MAKPVFPKKMGETPLKPQEPENYSPANAFLAAAQFLTIVPPVLKRPFTPPELGQAVGYYPLVGLCLGVVLAAAAAVLALLFPVAVSLVLVLALWVILTGVLHLDGFLDACDGLFGGWKPEMRLEIMRDERVGAFALAGGTLLLLAKYAALTALPSLPVALLIAPVLGRWAMSLALIRTPYARPAGLGRTIKDQASNRELVLATITAVLVAVGIGRLPGLVALLVVLGVTVGGSRFVMQRIPGLTGDIYGALCELNEVIVLLVLVAG